MTVVVQDLIELRTCTGCGVAKPLSSFRLQKRPPPTRPTLYSKCRDCEISYMRSPAYRVKANKKNAHYRAEGRAKERDKRHFANARSKYPEKLEAKRLVKIALDNGSLTRPNACESCGNVPPPMSDGRSAIHGHHDDYSKPLVVRWVCHACHIRIHRARASIKGEG